MAENERKFPVMLVVGLIVVGLILAGGVSYFIATKVMSSKADVGGSAREPGVFMKVGDPKEGLIINIGNINSGRYLKIGMIIELKPDKKGQISGGKGLSPEEVKIQDTVIYTLRSQKVEDFEPGKQDRLKELIKQEVNRALGGDRVYDVYITNFVLQ